MPSVSVKKNVSRILHGLSQKLAKFICLSNNLPLAHGRFPSAHFFTSPPSCLNGKLKRIDETPCVSHGEVEQLKEQITPLNAQVERRFDIPDRIE
jgi:hypothetical protein